MDYVRAVESSEALKKSKTFNDFGVSVQYTPRPYVVLQSSPNCGSDLFQKELSKLGRLSYFTMKITGIGNGISQRYLNSPKLGNYFDYRFENDITIFYDGIEVKPSLYHFVHGNDLSTERTFLMAFDLEEAKQDIQLKVKSDVFHFGEMNFQFDFKNVPTYNPS